MILQCTPCLRKNVPHLGCYNCETWERILIFFGRNVTDKVRNQKTYYYATSNNLHVCATWQNGETRKSHFNSNAVLVDCLNSISCLISLIFLTQRLTFTMLYDSLYHVINAFNQQDC